jgi:hypothetical protein
VADQFVDPPGVLTDNNAGSIEFAPDSPLEGRRFELLVPLAKRVGVSGGKGSAAEAKRAVWKSSLSCAGTEGSNLLPSSGESLANLTQDGFDHFTAWGLR